MRSYASAYKMCVATFPKPSQPDGSIAPCRPTRSPATGSVGMADVIAFCPRGGVSSYLYALRSQTCFARLRWLTGSRLRRTADSPAEGLVTVAPSSIRCLEILATRHVVKYGLLTSHFV